MKKIIGVFGIGLIGIAAVIAAINMKKAPSGLDEAYAKAMADLKKEEKKLRKTIKDKKEVERQIKERKEWLDKEFNELMARQLADIQIV